MALLTASDLAGLRGVLGALAWDDPANAATVYDAPQSNPRTVPFIVDNASALKSGRDASSFIVGLFPVGSAVVASNVVNGHGHWYVVKQVADAQAEASSSLQTQVLHLPYTVTRTRYSTGQAQAALNWNGEPYVDGQGVPVAPTTTTIIRYGFSNDLNDLLLQPEGAEPGGITTYYAPLGSDIQRDDRLTLADGRRVIVQQTNLLGMAGYAFALQLILNEESESGRS